MEEKKEKRVLKVELDDDVKKVLIEREKSDARIGSSEREEARPKVKILFLHGFFASGQCQPALALREAFNPTLTLWT